MKTKFIYFTVISIITMLFGVMVQNVNSQQMESDVNITKISELIRYTDSYIKGEVVRILDTDEFRLKDSSGKIKVYTGWKNTNMVKKGEIVTVRGIMDPGVIKEFYATEIIRENGEVVKLKSDE